MKYWNMDRMRNFCIRHDYFDAGSNKAYSSLLNFVQRNEPTDRHIETAAIFIIARTSVFEDVLDGGTDAVDAVVDCIVWGIKEEVVINLDIEEEEE